MLPRVGWRRRTAGPRPRVAAGARLVHNRPSRWRRLLNPLLIPLPRGSRLHLNIAWHRQKVGNSLLGFIERDGFLTPSAFGVANWDSRPSPPGSTAMATSPYASSSGSSKRANSSQPATTELERTRRRRVSHQKSETQRRGAMSTASKHLSPSLPRSGAYSLSAENASSPCSWPPLPFPLLVENVRKALPGYNRGDSVSKQYTKSTIIEDG
jgi:hypothetical protein